jgi:hypothetical protein
LGSYSHGQAGEDGGYHTSSTTVGYGGAVTDCNWAGGGGTGWYGNGDSVSYSHCFAGAGGIRPLEGGYGGDSNGCADNNYNGDFFGGFGGGGGTGIHLGGGGGGYTGGEGGGYCSGTQQPGGGGSLNVGDSPQNQSGYHDGNGEVTLTKIN